MKKYPGALTGAVKRKEFINYYVSFSFLFIVCLTLITPEDILTRAPYLDELISFAEKFFPPLRKFGEMSRFSEVAQFVYVIQLVCSAGLLVYAAMWYLRLVPAKKIVEKPLLSILLMLFSIFVVVAYVVYFPAGIGRMDVSNMESRSELSPSAKIAYSMLSSKLGFAFWSTLITHGFAMFVFSLLRYGLFIKVVFLNKESQRDC